MYKLAVFDMDGTLLDTVEDLYMAGNHALRQFGYPEHPREAYKLFAGGGLHNLVIQALKPVEDTAAIEQVEAVFRVYYEDHAQDYTKPYDGMVEALCALKRAGLKTAVLSNKPDTFARALAEQYFPGIFDVAYGQREGVPLKPDPTALEEILSICGCSGEECVYVGDTGIDVHTGKNVGAFTIGVTWGFRARDELESAGADSIIDQCDELIKIIVDKK